MKLELVTKNVELTNFMKQVLAFPSRMTCTYPQAEHTTDVGDEEDTCRTLTAGLLLAMHYEMLAEETASHHEPTKHSFEL